MDTFLNSYVDRHVLGCIDINCCFKIFGSESRISDQIFYRPCSAKFYKGDQGFPVHVPDCTPVTMDTHYIGQCECKVGVVLSSPVLH